MRHEVGPGIAYEADTHTLVVNGLRYSPEVLAHLAPPAGGWAGPFWIRRNTEMEVAEITTLDPAATSREH